MQILTYDALCRVTGPIAAGSGQDRNARSMLLGLNTYGAETGLNQLHRVSYYLGQLLHESAGFKYDRELWGPTPAQARYDMRTDLGNTPARDGDGYRYRGRGPIQITGKSNYQQFTTWARALDPAAPDFVADPDAVNLDPWEGLVPIWYWTTRNLNALADAGDLRAITRRINGGYNGLSDRRRWTGRAQLVLLGHGATDARGFQRVAGLQVDGQIGAKTRLALHQALAELAARPAIAAAKSNPTPKPATGPLAWLRAHMPWLFG